MTAVLENSIEPTPDADPDGAVLASWPARAGAFAVDVLVGLGVIATLAPVAWTAAQRDWLWWLCVIAAAVVLFAMAANRLLLPTLAGWSLGRALLGIAVVGRGGDTAGPWRLLARDVAHVLDTVPVFLGWLWPLWDSRRRTFADLLARTEVLRVAPKPLRARGIAVITVAAAAAVAVGAAALGYVTVYRHDLRVAGAREQLAVQGPAIVTDTLSYRASTLQADFDRAKSLVTEGYRAQLEAQQRVVQKAPVVDNEYWATNAAVLSATQDRGTVLVFLQGQRGAPPSLRTITATVKADFERAGGGQWKLAGLSVLAKPQPGGGG